MGVPGLRLSTVASILSSVGGAFRDRFRMGWMMVVVFFSERGRAISSRCNESYSEEVAGTTPPPSVLFFANDSFSSVLFYVFASFKLPTIFIERYIYFTFFLLIRNHRIGFQDIANRIHPIGV